MAERDTASTVTRLLPLTTILWLVYLLALLLIDKSFYPRPIYSVRYYVLNGADALIVLGLAVWPASQRWLGRAFLPLVIGLMSAVPLVTSNLTVLPLPPGPDSGPESTMLRLIPILFLALIVTAWEYRWAQVLLFIGLVAVLTLSLNVRFFRPGGAPLMPPIIVLIIQTVSFLVVGYFVNVLAQRLRRQQDSLAQANAQLSHYAATLEELTISRERNRMARELHDTLAHTLSGLSVQLETAKAYWDVDPQAARSMLDESLVATREGLQETRRALKSLRATPLDDLGLVLALRKMAEETTARANLRLELLLPPSLPALTRELEQCVYRVAQEAVANAAHHANARTLSLELDLDDTSITLVVRDDGVGFNTKETPSPGHFGLAGMWERAQLAGGTLSVESSDERGTVIRLSIEV
jgi:signal transduction histidine kinase